MRQLICRTVRWLSGLNRRRKTDHYATERNELMAATGAGATCVIGEYQWEENLLETDSDSSGTGGTPPPTHSLAALVSGRKRLSSLASSDVEWVVPV